MKRANSNIHYDLALAKTVNGIYTYICLILMNKYYRIYILNIELNIIDDIYNMYTDNSYMLYMTYRVWAIYIQ